MARRAALVCLIASAIFVLAPPADARTQRLTLTSSIEPFELRLSADETEVTSVVFIGVTKAVTSRRIPRFALSALRVISPAYARPPSGASLTMRVGGADVTNGGFRPRRAGSFAASVTISGLDQNGLFEGDILGAAGSRPLTPLLHVTIKRSPDGALTLAGFSAGSMSVAVATGDLDVPLKVQGLNDGVANAVNLDVDPPRAQDGSVGTTELAGNTVPNAIEGIGSYEQVVRFSLPHPDTYLVPIRLAYDGLVHDFSLSLSWTLLDPGVEIVSTSGVAADAPTCLSILGNPTGLCRKTLMYITIHETEGKRVTIDAPTLLSLIRRDGDKDSAGPGGKIRTELECAGEADESPIPSTATPFASSSAGPSASPLANARTEQPVATASQASTGSIPPEGSANPQPAADESTASPSPESSLVACGRASFNPGAQTLTLEPGAAARLRVELAGDLAIGTYVTQVQMGSTGTTTLAAEATAFYRMPLWAALVIFVIGCTFGGIVRQFLTVDRGKAFQQLRIGRLAAAVQAAAPPKGADIQADSIAAFLEARADQLFARVGAGEADDVDAAITDLRLRVTRFDQWLRVRGRVLGGLLPELAETPTTQLDLAANVFMRPTSLTEADQAVLEGLDALEGTVSQAEGVSRRIRALRAAATGREQAFASTVEPHILRAIVAAQTGNWTEVGSELQQGEVAVRALPPPTSFVDAAAATAGASASDPQAAASLRRGRSANWARRLSATDQQLTYGDQVVNIILVSLTILGGLAFLWAANPTWGSFPDILTALLWSMGVQEVSNASFTGVIGLKAQVLRTPQA